MTELEEATLEAGSVFRAAPFGRALQRYHPSQRAGAPGDPHEDSLVTYEINHSPAIRRALMVLQMHERANEPIDVSSAQRYLGWVKFAQRAVQRLADQLWHPIPVEIRTLVVDQDDLGPAMSSYLPGSRFDRPEPVLQFENLSAQPTRDAWQAVREAAQATDCYAAARSSAESLSEPDTHLKLEDHRREVEGQVSAVLTRGPITVKDADKQQREIVDRAYSEAPEELRGPALRLRAYNELVNHILWAVLGIAERTDELIALTSNVGTVRVSGPKQGREVLVTVQGLGGWLGSPPAPYVLRAGLPVDGLYLSRGALVQGGLELTLDVRGRSIRQLEAA